MFTNNMHKLMNLLVYGGNYNTAVSGFVNASGTTFFAYRQYIHNAGILNCARYMYAQSITGFVAAQASGTISNGLYLGNGATPATQKDYTLESPITSGLTVSGNGNTPSLENVVEGVYSYNYSFSVTNTSENEINIYEIGLFVPLYSSTYTSGAPNMYYVPQHSTMVKRDVLTEPITIAPGATKVINYKLTFNQTLNVD